MLSYGGIPLAGPTPQDLDFINTRIDPKKIRHFQRRSFPNPRLTQLPYRVDYQSEPPALQTLRWPVGATRFAEGYFLCTDQELARITPQAYAGGTWNPLPLVLADGKRPPLSVDLWMLPPRPIMAATVPYTPTIPGAWILTLVDVRYRWPDTGALLVVDGTTTTWVDLFQQIAGALGISLAIDAINSAYLLPPGIFAASYENLAEVFEAALISVGQRLVANYDGTFATNNAQTSFGTMLQNQIAQGPRWAGGQFRLVPTVLPDDTISLTPSSVTVVNPNSTVGVTATTVTLSALALPQYGSLVGNGDSHVWHSPVIHTGTNGAAVTALAHQIASDWYLWNLGQFDEVLIGAAAWEPEGYHDLLWSAAESAENSVSVRVTRFPWNDLMDVTEVPVTGTVKTVLSQHPGTGDSTTTIANPTKIEIDLSSGLYLINDAGAAEIGAQDASYTHKGVVNLATQTLGRGVKRFADASSEFNALQIVPFTNPSPTFANQSNPGVGLIATVGPALTEVWIVPPQIRGAPGATLADLPVSLLQWGGGGILPLGVYAAIDDSAYVRLGVTGLSKSGGQLKIVRGIVVGEVAPVVLLSVCPNAPGVTFPTTMYFNIACVTPGINSQVTLIWDGVSRWIGQNVAPPGGDVCYNSQPVLQCTVAGWAFYIDGQVITPTIVSLSPFVADLSGWTWPSPFCNCTTSGTITGG